MMVYMEKDDETIQAHGCTDWKTKG